MTWHSFLTHSTKEYFFIVVKIWIIQNNLKLFYKIKQFNFCTKKRGKWKILKIHYPRSKNFAVQRHDSYQSYPWNTKALLFIYNWFFTPQAFIEFAYNYSKVIQYFIQHFISFITLKNGWDWECWKASTPHRAFNRRSHR